MNPDLSYEDETFVELHKRPDASTDAEGKVYFRFAIQHKGSETVYQVLARDRDELAAKIAAGEYEDIDRRNDRSPANLDDDATDE